MGLLPSCCGSCYSSETSYSVNEMLPSRCCSAFWRLRQLGCAVLLGLKTIGVVLGAGCAESIQSATRPSSHIYGKLVMLGFGGMRSCVVLYLVCGLDTNLRICSKSRVSL